MPPSEQLELLKTLPTRLFDREASATEYGALLRVESARGCCRVTVELRSASGDVRQVTLDAHTPDYATQLGHALRTCVGRTVKPEDLALRLRGANVPLTGPRFMALLPPPLPEAGGADGNPRSPKRALPLQPPGERTTSPALMVRVPDGSRPPAVVRAKSAGAAAVAPRRLFDRPSSPAAPAEDGRVSPPPGRRASAGSPALAAAPPPPLMPQLSAELDAIETPLRDLLGLLGRLHRRSGGEAPARLVRLRARAAELRALLQHNTPEARRARWVELVARPPLPRALLLPPGRRWQPVRDVDELLALQDYAAQCAAPAGALVVAADRLQDAEAERRYEAGLPATGVAHGVLRAAAGLLRMGDHPDSSELLLWRGYRADEEVAGRWAWRTEPASSGGAAAAPARAVFAARALRPGDRPPAVPPATGRALLVRANVGRCAEPAATVGGAACPAVAEVLRAAPRAPLQRWHDSYFADGEFAVFDPDAVLPMYRLTLQFAAAA